MSAPAQPGADNSAFYRVDLFERGELTSIQFFEADELEAARQHASAAVTSGAADRAEVRDDADDLLFSQARFVPPPPASKMS